MGTGFVLDETDDPISKLLDLQKIAEEGLKKDKQHRPVGNIALMRIDNAQIKRFVTIKQRTRDEIDWKFNLSVNVTQDFMQAYRQQEKFELANGELIDPQDLLTTISRCAWDCGDPGLIFLDKMNQRRPFTKELEYSSVAPCGEVGLAKGETCQFASVNIAQFVSAGSLDYLELKKAVRTTTRFLDDVLEYSIRHYSNKESLKAMKRSRKIGIGLCGYSQLLTKLNMVYGSQQAKRLLENILSFINYHSKRESIELAAKRGSFAGFPDSKYAQEGNFLAEKFGDYQSDLVGKNEWKRLDDETREVGLRNSTTVALPPTGRSSIVFDTSQSIEPIFSLADRFGRVHKIFKEKIIGKYSPNTAQKILEKVREGGSCQDLSLPQQLKQVFRTAVEIGHRQHFDVLAAAQKFVDESVSKTINLPQRLRQQFKRYHYLSQRLPTRATA